MKYTFKYEDYNGDTVEVNTEAEFLNDLLDTFQRFLISSHWDWVSDGKIEFVENASVSADLDHSYIFNPDDYYSYPENYNVTFSYDDGQDEKQLELDFGDRIYTGHKFDDYGYYTT